MGLVRTQKVGEGMHISGRSRDIEITILSISGKELNRKVKFKIGGNNGLNELELSASQRYFNLTEDIKIEVSNKVDFGINFVSINYDAPKDYKLRRREDERDRRRYLVKKFNALDNTGRIVNINHPVGFYYREENKRRTNVQK